MYRILTHCKFHQFWVMRENINCAKQIERIDEYYLKNGR